MAGRKALFDADVQLMGAVPGTPDPLWRRHRVGTDGGFRFSLLQPGSYTLAIYLGLALASLPLPNPTRQVRRGGVGCACSSLPRYSGHRQPARSQTPVAGLGQRSPDPSNLGLRGRQLEARWQFRIRKRAAGRVYGRTTVPEPAPDRRQHAQAVRQGTSLPAHRPACANRSPSSKTEIRRWRSSSRTGPRASPERSSRAAHAAANM